MSEFGPSLEDVLRVGEGLYLNKFKEELEKDHFGHYAVIDIEKGEFVVNESQVVAIDQAKAKFGNKLFYTVKVGSLDKPSINYRKSGYAWNF